MKLRNPWHRKCAVVISLVSQGISLINCNVTYPVPTCCHDVIIIHSSGNQTVRRWKGGSAGWSASLHTVITFCKQHGDTLIICQSLIIPSAYVCHVHLLKIQTKEPATPHQHGFSYLYVFCGFGWKGSSICGSSQWIQVAMCTLPTELIPHTWTRIFIKSATQNATRCEEELYCVSNREEIPRYDVHDVQPSECDWMSPDTQLWMCQSVSCKQPKPKRAQPWCSAWTLRFMRC